MANKSVVVELRAQVQNYLLGMQQAQQSTKQTARQVRELAKIETEFKSAVAAASQSVQQHGVSLDRSTKAGEANQQALARVAGAAQKYRNTLISQGASQQAVAEATERGRTEITAAATAMGMSERQAKRFATSMLATESAASRAAAAISANRAAIDSLALGAGLIGAAAVLGVGKAIKTYADFDKEMSVVAAQGQEAKASLEDLRQTAIKAGADTMFSAQDAAEGITALLKAGLSAKDVMSGGLAGALDLAASGEMAVGDAAEATAVALAQFHLKGNQASHVADLLAAGANKAQGEVSDMAMALAQGGLVANQTGLTIEETTAALTAFASAGLLGSDAGTSLKTMLQRLTPQSAEAQKEMDKLGISAYDSQGKFIGLAAFAGNLQDKLSGLSPEARNAALSVMFGTDAVRAAAVLYDEGAAGIQKWTEAVNQQGFAQRQAAEMTNNLAGDIERLGGSLDSVFIQSGSGANAVLRDMAQGAEAFVNQVGEIPAPVLSALTALVGAGGLATLGVMGLLKLSSVIVQARQDMTAFGISTKTAGIAASGVGVAISLATLAVVSWAQQAADAAAQSEAFASTLVVIDDRVQQTDATMQAIRKTLSTADFGSSGLFGSIIDQANAAGITVDEMTKFIADSDSLTQTGLGTFTETNEQYAEMVRKLNELDNTYGASNPKRDQFLAKLKEIKSNLTESQKQALAAADGANTYSEALAASTGAGEAASSVLKKFTDQMFEAANAELKLSGTEVGWQKAIDDTTDAIKENGKAHRTASGDLDLNTRKGQENQAVLDQLATSSLSYVSTMMEQGKSEDEVRAKMERSRKQFIKSAEAAGMTEDAAKRLADEYGLIPSNVSTTLTVEVSWRGALSKSISVDGKGAGKIALKEDGGMMARVRGLLLDQFASGGTWGQPQVRPFQGADGVQWGEAGSGPWEAFISGAPQKRDRSIAIWREVGRRLLGDFSAADMVAGFADGGIKEPTHRGKPLSWWQDYLKSNLELTQLRIQIRDLKRQLNAKGKDRLKGLDRTAARQELAQDQKELALSVEAGKLNRSKAGTIAKRLADWEKADQKAKDAKDAADQKVQDAEGYADQWMSKYLEGSSAADLLDNLKKGASEIASYNDALGSLGKQGLKDPVLQWLWGQGPDASQIAMEILAGGKSSIDQLNAASGNLAKAADAAGQSQATGTWYKSPSVPKYTAPTVEVPGYVASGSVVSSSVLPSKTVKFYVTQDDPYAASVVINQQLKDL